jgi:peptidoglycan/LPS O-acetylase OafA/YrhL
MPDIQDETPIPGERKHQPELDGIRGTAILLVLMSHTAGQLGVLPATKPALLLEHLLVPMWGGVDLFFVLSGFLITGILLRTRTKAHYFKSFYARRVLRIFPIYYLALIGTLVAAHFFPAIQDLLPAPGMERISYFLYLQNMPVFWQELTVMGGLWGVYWSLAVEEQFYMVWPLMVKFLSSRTMLTICVVCFVLELPLRLLLIHFYFGMDFCAIQFTPDRMDGLFMGAAIALYMYIRKQVVPLPWIKIAGSCGVVILLYVFFRYPEELASDGHLYTIGVTAYALLGGALVAWSQHHPAWMQRILSLRVLRQAGKYSYGMYVYHLFLFFGVRNVMQRLRPQTGGTLQLLPALGVMMAAILATWLVAKLSYDLFESRFLALKRFFPASGGAVSG